jgi:hypothetical protein
MLIALISILLLVLLGMLNASAFVSAKHPKLKEAVDKTTPYESYLGLAGILFGILEILSSFSHMGILAILGLITGIVTLALGILSAAGYMKSTLFRDNSAAHAKLDLITAKIGVYQQNLGLGAILLAIIYLLLLLGA